VIVCLETAPRQQAENPAKSGHPSSDEDWSNYYNNITEDDIRDSVALDEQFSFYEFSVNNESHDLYFVGIKNGVYLSRTDRSPSIETHPFAIAAETYSLMLREQREQLSHYSGLVNEKRDNNKAMIAENERLHSCNERNMEEITKIYLSRSWKITLPLRAIATHIQSFLERR
jgi:hypothetical protein